MTRPAALLLLFLTTPAFAAPDQTLVQVDKVDRAVRAEIEKQKLVGLAIAVINDGKITWTKGYGYADREKEIPVNPALTQFRWASISKSITAITALQLAEKGQLDLDADVRTYVPEFPDKGVKITSRNLLCHQGGIVHYKNGPVVQTVKTYPDPHPFADVVVALDTFKESPLVNRPGEKYAYSTHGYILLSAVVERAGKQRFADQVKVRISDPLDMVDFRPDYHWEAIANRAVGYRRSDEAIKRRPTDEDHDVSWKLGGGGFTSTVIDLAKFGVGLIQRSLVSEETERLMWTVNKPTDPKGAKPYGLGFFVVEPSMGKRLVGHDGSQEKTRTGLLLDPKGKRGVAIMTNSEWFDPMELAMMLMSNIR